MVNGSSFARPMIYTLLIAGVSGLWWMTSYRSVALFTEPILGFQLGLDLFGGSIEIKCAPGRQWESGFQIYDPVAMRWWLDFGRLGSGWSLAVPLWMILTGLTVRAAFMLQSHARLGRRKNPPRKRSVTSVQDYSNG